MEPLITSLIGQIDTANILEFFTIKSVYDSKFELLVILLVEKEDLFPVEADLVFEWLFEYSRRHPFPIEWSSTYITDQAQALEIKRG